MNEFKEDNQQLLNKLICYLDAKYDQKKRRIPKLKANTIISNNLILLFYDNHSQ